MSDSVIMNNDPEPKQNDSKIKLRTKDDEIYEVSNKVVQMSSTLMHISEDTDDGNEMIIPVPTISSNTLIRVIEFCKHQDKVNNNDFDKNLMPMWNTKFMNIDDNSMVELIMAANYLDIKPLLDLTCKKIAAQIKGLPVDDPLPRFDIENDFTPEEEEEIRREGMGCVEPYY